MEKSHSEMPLLRFTTAGSVDDGKSTLIGRMLYDTKSIFEDQFQAVEQASKRGGNDEVNLALLTDGLRAERQQGITIDVAYRYFATPRRKFIIADTPGHAEYTRNMVTGASTASLAIILVDARSGITEQTVRHTFIASLLGINQIVVSINKMDLVDYSEEVYSRIISDYNRFCAHLKISERASAVFIPISAKYGDNVVKGSENMPWYKGMRLIEYLETVDIKEDKGLSLRLPVQYVIRPASNAFPDFRGYAGCVAEGEVKMGDRIKVLPSGKSSSVTALCLGERDVEKASKGESITMTISDDIDISRGDIIISDDGKEPHVGEDITLDICWLRESPLQMGKRYIIRHTTAEVMGVFKGAEYKIDVRNQRRCDASDGIGVNDIARVTLRTGAPLLYESYRASRTMGSLIVIDPDTNDTLGAGMIV